MSYNNNEITNMDQTQIDYIQVSNNVIDIISEILDEIVKESASLDLLSEAEEEQQTTTSTLIQDFLSKKPPQISINKYLKRFMKYSKPEPSTLIISLIYIDKICENSNLQLTMFNIHRLVFACLIVAIKYNEDDYYSNEYYAKVGGITLKELNLLEYNILILLDFNVFIDDLVYESYENQIKDYGKLNPRGQEPQMHLLEKSIME